MYYEISLICHFGCRGFEQMEVTCSHSSKGQITYWNVEEVVDPRCKMFIC